jgi:hypothetical protein
MLAGVWKVKLAEADSLKQAVWTFSGEQLTIKDGRSSVTVPFRVMESGRFTLTVGVFAQKSVVAVSVLDCDADTMLVRLTRDDAAPVLLVLCKDTMATEQPKVEEAKRAPK